MKTALLLLIALFFSGCGRDAQPSIAGPISVPTRAFATSGATEEAIANEANAAAKGDKAAVKAAKVEQKSQDRAELNGGLRWEVLAGVLLLAVGAGVAWYLGPKLGGGIAIVGAVVTFGAMTVRVIEPFMDYIVWSALAAGLIVAGLHFRKYISAALHLAHGTTHLASAGVKDLIGKMQARGPGILTRVKALLHHAPIAPKPSA